MLPSLGRAATALLMNSTTPPSLNGTLQGWPLKPTLVLNKKEYCTLGRSSWNKSILSATVYVTYDQKNLYIAAKIMSKNPEFNSQDRGQIYNGDDLELYLGTNDSNPKRTSYQATDYQIGISPGNHGENKQVYDFTDKVIVPHAHVATSLVPHGYVLEASIPLAYFYKLHVGPGQKIGFDVGLDDCGPTGTTRNYQLVWSKSSDGWKNPSVWGQAKFEGNIVLVNTASKVGGAPVADLNPADGKKGASTTGVLLWGFNNTLGGFSGSVGLEHSIVSEGTGAMVVTTTGSSGWNQNLAVCSQIPHAKEWGKFKAISMDVFLPKGSLANATFGQVFLVVQSPANSWYEVKFHLQEGWNHLKARVDPKQMTGGVYKVYLVANSGGPISGNMIVDNIRGYLQGAKSVLSGVISNTNGLPLAKAILTVDHKEVVTNTNGAFSLALPAGHYVIEVFDHQYRVEHQKINVLAHQTNTLKVQLKPDNYKTHLAEADIFFNKKIRTINPHYMFGMNIAAWYDPSWMTNPTALKRIKAISSYFRIPGGAFGNVWDWKTGNVFNNNGTIGTHFAFTWPKMASFIKSMGPHAEILLIANIMTMSVHDTLEWIKNIKERGIKLRYVELGNEPDYAQSLEHNGKNDYWTSINNYCKAYLKFAKAIHAKYPHLQLMGPVCAQVNDHQQLEGEPWLAKPNSPWWVSQFLKKCAPYVNVVSVHSYPYWPNDSDQNLLSKISLWSKWVPKIRAAIQKYKPNSANHIQISVSEWNSGVENPTTARLVNGVFCADYLAQMMLWGVNQTCIWDLFTQKPGLGGGHGVMDPNNNPYEPFEPRATYWALDMLRNDFGTTLYQAVSNQPKLSVYASQKNGIKYLLIINQSPNTVYKTIINLGHQFIHQKSKLDFYTLGRNQYQWSVSLYRPVWNTGPLHQTGSHFIQSRFVYSVQPYSITCIKITPIS